LADDQKDLLGIIGQDLFRQSGWRDGEQPGSYMLDLCGLALPEDIVYFKNKLEEPRGDGKVPAASVRVEKDRIHVQVHDTELLREAQGDIQERTLTYHPADVILSRRVKPPGRCDGFWERAIYTDEEGNQRGSINMNAHILFPPSDGHLRVIVFPGMHVHPMNIEGINLSMELPEQLLGGPQIQNRLVRPSTEADRKADADMEVGEYLIYSDPNIMGGKGVRFFLGCYPDIHEDPKSFEDYLRPSVGPAGAEYSLYAKHIADSVFRPMVESLKGIKDPSVRKEKVDATIEQFSNVKLFSYSVGCAHIDGLEKALAHMLESSSYGGMGWTREEVDRLFSHQKFLAVADFDLAAWRGEEERPRFSGVRVSYRDDMFVDAMASGGIKTSPSEDIKHKEVLDRVVRPSTVAKKDFPERPNAVIPVAGGRQVLYLASIPNEQLKITPIVDEEQKTGSGTFHAVERKNDFSHGVAEYFGGLITQSEGSVMVPMAQAAVLTNFMRSAAAKRNISAAEALLTTSEPLLPPHPSEDTHYMMARMAHMKGLGYGELINDAVSNWQGKPAIAARRMLDERESESFMARLKDGNLPTGWRPDRM
jgi:hypothetical protein